MLTTVGLLFRDLPVGIRFHNGDTLRNIFADVHEQVNGAIEHSCYPYVESQAAQGLTEGELACLLYQRDIRDMNVEYLQPYYMVMCSFSIAIIMQSLLGILIIGEGKTVVAAIVIMVGGTLNCVLDYVFMKHLHMGIRGAAIATVIGYCISIYKRKAAASL